MVRKAATLTSPFSSIIEGDVLTYPLSSLGTFQGILVDPPLRSNNAPLVTGTITPAEFGKLHITPKVIPNGLIFVWVEKEMIVEVHRHSTDSTHLQ